MIDAGTREVLRAGRAVRLTAKEFDLLWFLAGNPRLVFSRDQLMDRVWGYEAAFDTGTVTSTSAAPREDRGRPVPAAARPDRLGRRLPVRPVIAEALAVAAGTLAVGLAAAWLVRRLPTLRARVIGLRSAPSCCRPSEPCWSRGR